MRDLAVLFYICWRPSPDSLVPAVPAGGGRIRAGQAPVNDPQPTRGRARDAEMGSDCHVAGAMDEIAKPMVITPLGARCGRHPDQSWAARSRRSTPRGHGEPSVAGRSAAVTAARAEKCRSGDSSARIHRRNRLGGVVHEYVLEE